TREGLPLIRYRTHDLTRVLSRAPCACGRTHLRLDRLHGRTDDMVIFRGVNFYPWQIESLLLQQPGAGHEYQIVLERTAGGSDRLALLLAAGGGFAGSGRRRLGSAAPAPRSGERLGGQRPATAAPRAARAAQPEPGDHAAEGGRDPARAGQSGAGRGSALVRLAAPQPPRSAL